ncbi:hypothetical protein N782_10370 [Pontibacillus yanchengensis Y32]|uniref:Uncharacterized protein n=1 Tax=Pontibacillus yanchengensis Y32 TaxID=1385514 RepID=A0A0A2TU78_9BACI|nr:hypothetical protein N782_10370 [Pontibacillus yanchengensis Y32]
MEGFFRCFRWNKAGLGTTRVLPASWQATFGKKALRGSCLPLSPAGVSSFPGHLCYCWEERKYGFINEQEYIMHYDIALLGFMTYLFKPGNELLAVWLSTYGDVSVIPHERKDGPGNGETPVEKRMCQDPAGRFLPEEA